jgi:hypothetical protein
LNYALLAKNLRSRLHEENEKGILIFANRKQYRCRDVHGADLRVKPSLSMPLLLNGIFDII